MVHKQVIIVLIVLIVFPLNASPAHLHPEKGYQNKWCAAHNGVTEYQLPDKTRVDCLTDTHAIEFDFAHKWAESVGQSLYYASLTGKKAGIVLIVEDIKDMRFVNRLLQIACYLDITVWIITPQD